MIRFSVKAGLAIAALLLSASPALAQSSTPIYDMMAAKEKGERFSLDQRKLCLLAIKTYDYGVKELDFDKPDSKKAVRADKALPFTAIDLKQKTQTKLLFDRAVSEVTSEFSVFKNSDRKTQKKLFSAAKGMNKTCGRSYQNADLSKYGTLSNSVSKFIGPMSSDDALICMNVALSGAKTDRSALAAGLIEMFVWQEVYEDSMRREGHPDDQIIERVKIDDLEERVKAMDSDKTLAMFDTCKDSYKKARYQADLAEDTPVEVPEIAW